MSRAADLFDRLRQGQLAALDQLISDREPESLFLDFKRSPGDGAGALLADADNKNLSKGISGFANSAGGVLVWGVDCRRDPATGNEIAAKQPLVDASGFQTKLEAAVSRATLPVHTGVQTLSINAGAGNVSGFVAVLVPQGSHGPVRSVVTNHYHLRAGSDFGIVPHEVLAGMFGKRPQPNMAPNVISHHARLSERRDDLVLSLRIVVGNFGMVLCERPYLSIWFGNYPPQRVNASCPRERDYTLRRGTLPGISVTGHADVAVPPGATEELCDLTLHVPLGYNGPISLDCTVGCLGAEPHKFSFRATEESLRKGFDRARANDATLVTSDVLVWDVPRDDG